MLNKAILMGRLTRDPELRYTQSNLPVVSFTVAIDRRYGGNNGGERQTDFINVVAWRRTAEFVSQWFTKGMMIVVVGSIQSRNWQDKNGNNRTSIEVVADEVQFGESKRSRDANGGYQGGYDDGGYQNSYSAPQQPQPAPSFDMPAGNSDFSEISDDDGEIPF
ncbi:MAG: single-stranded DNA-binding protein [Eubacteriales bacterium]|nr:single-stranded DNA-binding protein [Eubacteriales bacterium]